MSRYLLLFVATFFSVVFSGNIWANEAEKPANEVEKQYFALFVDGKKCGLMATLREVTVDKVRNVSLTKYEMQRLGDKIVTLERETSIETLDGRPLEFESMKKNGANTQKLKGKVVDGKVEYVFEVMGEKRLSHAPWPKQALLTHGVELLIRKKGLEKGTKYSFKQFMPSMKLAADVNVEVKGIVDTELIGSVERLHEVSVNVMIGEGLIRQILYLNDNVLPRKIKWDWFGHEIVAFECDKEYAKSSFETYDMVAGELIMSPEPLTEYRTAKKAVYKIKAKKNRNICLPDGGLQKVDKHEDGEFVVTVTKKTLPDSAAFRYDGKDSEILKYLEADEYIQCDDPDIVAAAKHVSADSEDAAEVVNCISKFVSRRISDRNMSIGYATATEVYRTREGDCTEFAVLTAAMCRAVGIPCRVTCGLMYVDNYDGKNFFAGHAWNEVYLDGRWYGIDSTLGEDGFDVGHIKLTESSGWGGDMLEAASTYGYFEITSAKIEQ